MLLHKPSRMGQSRFATGRAIGVLSFGLVANLAPLMTFVATLHEIAAGWGLSASQSGWIGGIYFAGYAIAVPALASATDRMDGRRVYVGSALLGAVASLAFAVGAWFLGSADLTASRRHRSRRHSHAGTQSADGPYRGTTAGTRCGNLHVDIRSR